GRDTPGQAGHQGRAEGGQLRAGYGKEISVGQHPRSCIRLRRIAGNTSKTGMREKEKGKEEEGGARPARRIVRVRV
ncbi:MAG: hypothetical protein MJE68_09010, partial [Proteobacteria bacterium]|nr:hypothetical protein [Pseudomonadota bacterium]